MKSQKLEKSATKNQQIMPLDHDPEDSPPEHGLQKANETINVSRIDLMIDSNKKRLPFPSEDEDQVQVADNSFGENDAEV